MLHSCLAFDLQGRGLWVRRSVEPEARGGGFLKLTGVVSGSDLMITAVPPTEGEEEVSCYREGVGAFILYSHDAATESIQPEAARQK